MIITGACKVIAMCGSLEMVVSRKYTEGLKSTMAIVTATIDNRLQITGARATLSPRSCLFLLFLTARDWARRLDSQCFRSSYRFDNVYAIRCYSSKADEEMLKPATPIWISALPVESLSM
jgi:hypothetical protein